MMLYVPLLLFLLMNIQFSANSTIMLLTALHYASICSYASALATIILKIMPA